MSRIGKKPITIPADVTVKLEGSTCTVTGPKGTLTVTFDPVIAVNLADNTLVTSIANESDRRVRTVWGTTRALLQNSVVGVREGYQKKLEIVGVGYRVQTDGKNVALQVGYSHSVDVSIPAGITVAVEKNTLTISGIDKQLVGQFAAVIRSARPPEPYKGKGIKYADETIRRKAGKVVKAVGG